MANLKGGTFEKQLKDAFHRLEAFGVSRVGKNDNLTHSDKLAEKREMYLKDITSFFKSQNINKRELDMLLSTGEQVSASKLAILLNLIGHKSISLNGYQAQIYTNNNYQNASIIKIDTERIKKELAGYNIYSIGRYGSWTYCSIEDNIKEALDLSNKIYK